ncbi:MAG TPA: Gldg family protein [Verrucomicrobiae bacterium]|nr:Gldg family protein [Verrucomicrobiae bacterium]
MKEKKLETLLFSTVGVLVMFVIVVAVNLIATAFKSRLDLTKEHAFTLSKGTRAILTKLDSPVELRLYYSQSQERVPSQFKTFAKRVEDLLSEFRQAAHGNIEVKKLDPQPDSEAEDLANLDGIEGQMTETGDKFYLGLAVSLDPHKVALPFLNPARDRLLEYDLARAIAQVLSTNKAVMGIMTALPVFGQPMNPMMMRMGQQGQDPWTFVSELKKDYEVRQVQPDVEKIDDDIKVLMVIHPKDLKDTTLYAIDQFIMRGGKLIGCLDPMSLSDVNRQNPMMPMPGGGSNLEKLLKAWGLAFDTTKVAADMSFARKLVTRGNQAEIIPTVLFVTEAGIGKDDAVASQIDEVLLPFPGVFTGTPVSGLKETVLLRTTKNSQLVEPFMAQMSPAKIVDDFKASDTSYALAVRLEGKFKTAFPDGKPESKSEDKDKDKDKDAKKDEKKDENKAKDTLKETKTDNAVMLIGDTDWLSDQFSVQVGNFFGQKFVQFRNGNLPLVQNIVEQFAGDQNLIGVRSRGTLNRPFTVVKEMQAQANARFQAEIAKLQKEADEANHKLSELQGKKEAGQRFVLSHEQQEEIEKFKQKRADANKKLKRVRRELAQEIDSLELRTKILNIAGMPLLVAAAGIGLAVVRKQKTKAQ